MHKDIIRTRRGCIAKYMHVHVYVQVYTWLVEANLKLSSRGIHQAFPHDTVPVLNVGSTGKREEVYND